MKQKIYITSDCPKTRLRYEQIIRGLPELERYNTSLCVLQGLASDSNGLFDSSKLEDVYMLEIEDDSTCSITMLGEDNVEVWNDTWTINGREYSFQDRQDLYNELLKRKMIDKKPELTIHDK